MTSHNETMKIARLAGIGLLSFVLWACGSSTSSPTQPESVAIQCETQDDPNELEECGNLLLGLTDADGDFVSYTVDVKSIQMTRRDGTQIELLPTTQSIDFAQYVDMTELVTSATVPAGIYVSGSITLDYSNANIQVEKDGEAQTAVMVDDQGNPIGEITLDVRLDNRNQLIIARGIPALLELDFNLTASHEVDLQTDPITVTTEPFISAEVEPVMEKEFRIRGPLIEVNEAEEYYRIAVRPFHRTDRRYGGMNIQVNDDTSYEINGEAFTGEEGFQTMASLSQGTASVAFGIFNREAKAFTAISVYAGSSVPGFDKDAAHGVIIARNGNELTLKGATFVRDTGTVTFRDNAIVLVGENTTVFKARRADESVTIDSLSIGQAITVLGDWVEPASSDALATIDATEGAVRMRITAAAGHVNSAQAGEVVLDLQSIHGRPVALYDFSGTGVDSSFDADPQNYEVNTGNLTNNQLLENNPVRVLGFVNDFGAAPADFNALSVINYANSHTHMLVSWADEGSAAAFSELTESSMTLNMGEEILGRAHHVGQGGIRSDLTQADNAPIIVPKFERGLYGIKGNGSLQLFTDFAEFSVELQQRINDGEVIKLIHAQGGYDASETQLSAYKVSVIVN